MRKIFDLSHVLDENSYHPFGAASFRNVQMYASHRCRHAYVTMSLHFGTHMDAPWHMIEDGKRLDGISIQELSGEAVVVDVSEFYGPEKAELQGVSREVLENALLSHGNKLSKGDALIVYTGWAELFHSEPVRYFDSYCTLGTDACEWLSGLGIRLVGLDVSDIDLPDCYKKAPFEPMNHRMMLGKGIYVIENVGGEIKSLLNKRIYLLPAPLNLGGEYASGAPVRLLAMDF